MSRVRAHRWNVRSVHLACLHKVYSNSMYKKKGITWPNNRLFFLFESLCLQCTVDSASRSGPFSPRSKKKDKTSYKKKERGAALSSTPGLGPRNLTVMECDKVGVKGQVHECGGHRERVVAGEMFWTPQGGLSDAPRSRAKGETRRPRKGLVEESGKGLKPRYGAYRKVGEMRARCWSTFRGARRKLSRNRTVSVSSLGCVVPFAARR